MNRDPLWQTMAGAEREQNPNGRDRPPQRVHARMRARGTRSPGAMPSASSDRADWLSKDLSTRSPGPPSRQWCAQAAPKAPLWIVGREQEVGTGPRTYLRREYPGPESAGAVDSHVWPRTGWGR